MPGYGGKWVFGQKYYRNEFLQKKRPVSQDIAREVSPVSGNCQPKASLRGKCGTESAVAEGLTDIAEPVVESYILQQAQV